MESAHKYRARDVKIFSIRLLRVHQDVPRGVARCFAPWGSDFLGASFKFFCVPRKIRVANDSATKSPKQEL